MPARIPAAAIVVESRSGAVGGPPGQSWNEFKSAGLFNGTAVVARAYRAGRPEFNKMVVRSGWYFQKADQCGRRAKEATDPEQRRALEEEKRRWTEIADFLEREGTQQRSNE